MHGWVPDSSKKWCDSKGMRHILNKSIGRVARYLHLPQLWDDMVKIHQRRDYLKHVMVIYLLIAYFLLSIAFSDTVFLFRDDLDIYLLLVKVRIEINFFFIFKHAFFFFFFSFISFHVWKKYFWYIHRRFWPASTNKQRIWSTATTTTTTICFWR